jgi:hypothetical protein
MRWPAVSRPSTFLPSPPSEENWMNRDICLPSLFQ